MKRKNLYFKNLPLLVLLSIMFVLINTDKVWAKKSVNESIISLKSVLPKVNSLNVSFDAKDVIEKIRHRINSEKGDNESYFIEDMFYRAEFDQDGLTYYQKDKDARFLKSKPSLKYCLTEIALGTEAIIWNIKNHPKNAPTVRDNITTYIKTSNIREIYEARDGYVEQSWIIDELPEALKKREVAYRGDLIIEGKIETALKMKEKGPADSKGGIDFYDNYGNYMVSLKKYNLEILNRLCYAEKHG
jgi:hypothetical protein